MTSKYSRLLKQGMTGLDVQYMKLCLFALKYYTKDIKKITNSTFGGDTYKAVIAFQKKNKDTKGKKLKVDAVIGPLTWDSIEAAYKKLVVPAPVAKPVFLTSKEFPNLSSKTISALNIAWSGISQHRINMMKLCIKHMYDAVNGTYKKGDHLVGIYCYGANLYDTSDKLFIPSTSYINSRASAVPSYFNNGRKDFMLKELKHNPKLAASDCSGMIVGCGRKLGFVSNTFDATADTLTTNSKYSIAITKSALKPGDWVGKKGHVGIYLGANLVAEFAGGAYGAQITSLIDRKLRNMMTGNLENVDEYTRFRDPIWY